MVMVVHLVVMVMVADNDHVEWQLVNGVVLESRSCGGKEINLRVFVMGARRVKVMGMMVMVVFTDAFVMMVSSPDHELLRLMLLMMMVMVHGCRNRGSYRRL